MFEENRRFIADFLKEQFANCVSNLWKNQEVFVHRNLLGFPFAPFGIGMSKI